MGVGNGVRRQAAAGGLGGHQAGHGVWSELGASEPGATVLLQDTAHKCFFSTGCLEICVNLTRLGVFLLERPERKEVGGEDNTTQPESPQSQVDFLPIASTTTSLSHGWILLPQSSIGLMAPVLGPRAAAHRMQETSGSSSITIMHRLPVPRSPPCTGSLR